MLLTIRSIRVWLSIALFALSACEQSTLDFRDVNTLDFENDPRLTLAPTPTPEPSLTPSKLPTKEGNNGGEEEETIWRADNGDRGLVGEVYDISDLNAVDRKRATLQIIDLDSRTPESGKILMPTLDVTPRIWTDGFPGMPALIEWFAIRFEGRLLMDRAGKYQFALESDDGSLLFIDDRLVVENDGNHAPRVRASPMVTMTAGMHKMRVDYYQGPRQRIALRLLYRLTETEEFKVVPPNMLDRP